MSSRFFYALGVEKAGRVGLEPTFSGLLIRCCSSAKTSSSATGPHPQPGGNRRVVLSHAAFNRVCRQDCSFSMKVTSSSSSFSKSEIFRRT
jgi:hypothetical protein